MGKIFCPICGSELRLVARSSDKLIEVYECPNGCPEDYWVAERDDELRLSLRQEYETEISLC